MLDKYINKLRFFLKFFFTDEETDAIVYDYKELIYEKKMSGETDEQIILGIGKISENIKKIIHENHYFNPRLLLHNNYFTVLVVFLLRFLIERLFISTYEDYRNIIYIYCLLSNILFSFVTYYLIRGNPFNINIFLKNTVCVTIPYCMVLIILTMTLFIILFSFPMNFIDLYQKYFDNLFQILHIAGYIIGLAVLVSFKDRTVATLLTIIIGGFSTFVFFILSQVHIINQTSNIIFYKYISLLFVINLCFILVCVFLRDKKIYEHAV